MRNKIALAAVLAVATPWTSPPAVVAQPAAAQRAPTLEVQTLRAQTTEEGQSVIYDAYSWQRRELAKRLPLGERWPAESAIAAQFERFGLNRPPVPEFLPVPSRILPDVYLVNSKPNFTYLIDAGADELVIVDPGLEENVESILRNVEALGFSRSAIKWVLNTHAHFDHAMADAHFQRLGARILIGRADAPAVEKGTLITAKTVLPAPQQANYPTLRVDWPLDDGEELLLGNKKFVAIATPGHTPGSTCFLLAVNGQNILFGGDTVLFDYRLGAQGPFADNAAYRASFKKLASLGARVRWDVLLPGHGTIVLDRAYLDVAKGMRQVQLDLDDGAPVNALPFGDEYYRQLMFGRP